MAHAPFRPAPLLRSAHLQTLIGSRGRTRWVRARARPVVEAARRRVLTVNDGVRLESWVSDQPSPSPTVILIHGWLGHADSDYVLSAAATLWAAGFNVYRLNLRDHGNTAHLNEDLFHSARIDEVINAVSLLAEDHGLERVGLAGYSLGGNFALRVARATGMDTVAICPAVDPQATMASIDTGWIAYRRFFVRKWQRALEAKELAFPNRYRFAAARRLKTVGALTDLFVREHTEFPSTQAYFSAYSLCGNALEGTRATIVYAEDDPVIPAAGFDGLPDSLEVIATRHGGHCGHVVHPRDPTWSDRFLVQHFTGRLREMRRCLRRG